MIKDLKNMKTNLVYRNIIIVLFGLILLFASIFIYKDTKGDVFMDEYMEDIFVDNEEVFNNKVDDKGLIEVNKFYVEIKGEVNKPNVYEMNEGSIIKDLIDKAGGLKAEANIDFINRAEKLSANQLIVIPNINEEEPSIVTFKEEKKDNLVNINTAGIDELTKVNGIGEVKAQSIIDYRNEKGSFKTIEELKNIAGIGEKTFEKLKNQIKVN